MFAVPARAKVLHALQFIGMCVRLVKKQEISILTQKDGV